MTKQKGFTLIELLVVIAIIGILSSIVLASLNSARKKGQDASLEGSMSSLRTQAEIYYSDNSNSYNNLFTANNTWASTTAGVQSLLTAVNNISTTHTAGSSATAWAASAQLTATASTTYFCVDSTGTAKTSTTALTAGNTVCP